jgi:D-alanyl-lipoteichoic acid acyltransferase DltB (MBOAT superfamily)
MELDNSLFLLFLACVALLQGLLPARARVALLLTASLAFYAYASVNYLVLLLLLCAVNFAAVSSLSKNANDRRRTLVFASAVLLNLLVLICFKYASGLLGQMLAKLGWHGQDGAAFKIAAPLGISYFTFQMLACVTDAYRGNWRLERGFSDFVLFGLFFPQISSGPIPRAGGLLPQLQNGGAPTAEDRLAGLRMIAFGFFKKYVVASRLGEYVDAIFKDPPGNNVIPVGIACVFNAIQLYTDFSGYVDIAMGSARLLGIRLDANFDRPFSSTSVTEFWRRWHMTLTTWLRDYLYMPLVIRLRNFGKTGIVIVTLVTFAICGIWHGASWTFLLFGVAQGVAMIIEFLTKSWRTRTFKQVPKVIIARLGNLYTLAFFVLSQVLFRSVDLKQALSIYHLLFHVHLSGRINDFIGTRPYMFAFDLIGVGAWVAVAMLYRRTSDSRTPWFVALSASLIVFLGCVTSAHFIYAAF